MNELIKVSFEGEQPTVSGRELHQALQVRTAYKDWFPRMCEYGFVEDKDFSSFLSESTGGRPAFDHRLSIAMAKELCMIQRSAIGREFRQYFIKVEENWNSPESVMARALSFANQRLDMLRNQNQSLERMVAVQNQQISEMRPKVSYYDVVLQCKDLVPISVIAKDYGWSAKRMNSYLYEKGVQYKQGNIWLLYQKYAEKGYTSTKTFNTPGNNGELHNHVHTYWTQAGRLFIYDLLRVDCIMPLIERECGN